MKLLPTLLLAFVLFTSMAKCQYDDSNEDGDGDGDDNNQQVTDPSDGEDNKKETEGETENKKDGGENGLTRATTSPYCQQVQQWGYQCQDCSQPVKCIKSGQNWITLAYDKCADKTFCNKGQQKCSTEKDCEDAPTPATGTFKCNGVEGVFPNPFDCTSYYNCQKSDKDDTLTEILLKCPSGSAYNSSATQCNGKPTNADLCTKAQFTCVQNFDMGAYASNANIYYLCNLDAAKKITLNLFYCDDNQVFKDGQCGTSEGTTSSTQNSTVTQPTPTPTDCQRAGVFEDPTDCHRYVYCNAQLQRTVKTCPTNTHFDKVVKSCVLGANC